MLQCVSVTRNNPTRFHIKMELMYLYLLDLNEAPIYFLQIGAILIVAKTFYFPLNNKVMK